MMNRSLSIPITGFVIFLAMAFPVFAFTDVPSDHWAYDAIEYLAEKGLLEGYPDGSFRGDRELTRNEFAMVTLRIYNSFLDIVEDETMDPPGIDIELALNALMEEFQDELDELTDMVLSNTDRIQGLEDSVDTIGSDVDEINNLVDSMRSSFRPYGDIRLRFEGRYPETGLQTQRARYRIRPGFTSQINDELVLGARFVTGTSNTNCGSNATLDDAFGFDDISVDRAYLQYQPNSIPGFTFWGGKFAPPWHKTVLSWDGNINVEGIAQRYAHENFNFYLGELIPTVEGFFLVAQVQATDLFTEGIDGAVTYQYINDAAWGHIMTDMMSGDLKSRFLFDNLDNPSNFSSIDVWGRYRFAIGDLPVSIEGSYMQNLQDTITGVEPYNQAAWANLVLNGKPRDPGEWQFFVEWGRTQPNSVLSWTTDSCRGGGNTEWWGVHSTYRLLKNTNLTIWYYSFDRITGSSPNSDLIQIDFSTSFK